MPIVSCRTRHWTRCGVENQWKAGQFGKIKGDGYYWQAVQQARFANNLQELGYSIRKTKDAFEIDGVPDSAIKKFSLRTGDDRTRRRKTRYHQSQNQGDAGALATREAKDSSIPYPDLVEMWDKWLTPNERQAILEVADNAKPSSHTTDDRAHVQFATEHIFERSSVVDERRLMTLAMRHGVGEVTPEGVRAEVGKLGLLRREEDGKTLVTTKSILAEEGKVLNFATAGKNTFRPLVGDEPIEFNNKDLDEQQRRAVELPLRSADRLMIIKGKAGTGKTTLTAEAVAQIEARGKPVVIVAPTTPAVGVLRNDGFEADTLARLLVDPNMQERSRNGFIVLDEAGLVGSARPWPHCVMWLAQRTPAFCSWEIRAQLASVERGAPLHVLETIGKVAVAEVTEIRRQRSREYRDAVKLFAAGKAGEGLDKLDALGRIKTMPVWDKHKPVAKDYANKLGDVKPADRQSQATIVCPTHSEGMQINQAVRDELRARGMIGKEEHELRRLVPLQWSEAERGDRQRYAGDEIVQFHRNSKRFKAGEPRQPLRQLAARAGRWAVPPISRPTAKARSSWRRMTSSGPPPKGRQPTASTRSEMGASTW